MKQRYAGKVGSCVHCNMTVRVPVPEDDDDFALNDDEPEESGSSKSLLNAVEQTQCPACRKTNFAGMAYCMHCNADLPH